MSGAKGKHPILKQRLKKINVFKTATQQFKHINDDSVEVFTASQRDTHAGMPSLTERHDEEPKLPGLVTGPAAALPGALRSVVVAAKSTDARDVAEEPRQPCESKPAEEIPVSHPETAAAVLPSTEENDAEGRIYSSDDDERDPAAVQLQAAVVPRVPLALGSIPTLHHARATQQQLQPPALDAQQPAPSRPIVRFSALPDKEAPTMAAPMSSAATTPRKSKVVNKRPSPVRGLMKPPPLKLMKPAECLINQEMKADAEGPANLHAQPGQAILQHQAVLPTEPFPALAATPVPAPAPAVQSCLAGAMTAAQMVANNRGGEMEQLNQYALRPLPPPPLPPPSTIAMTAGPGQEASGNSSQLPSLGMLASGRSDGGLTQMGDSEPQMVDPAVNGREVAAAAPGGVRRAQELLLGRGWKAKPVDEKTTPTGGPGRSRFAPPPAAASPAMRPLLPGGGITAAPAAPPQTAAVAPAPCAAATIPPNLPAPLAALPEVPEATPVRPTTKSASLLTSPVVGGTAGSAQDIRPNPQVCINSPLADGTAIPSAARPGSAHAGARSGSGATGSERAGPSVELSNYLGGTLLDAMRVHGEVPDKIFQWQAECLTTDGGAVLDGSRNLVYAAPTSSGKTLVAEILMLRALVTKPGRKAMLVLPYVQLCIEKATRLAPLVQALNLQVVHSYGGHYSGAVQSSSAGIIVCTIENANNIINRRLESGTPLHDEYSCIVVDELHHLSDPDRGYQLELLLTKLRYQEKCFEAQRAAAAEAKAAEEAKSAAAGDSPFKTPARQHQQQGDGNVPASSSKQRDSSVRRTTTTTPHHTTTTVTGTTGDGSKESKRIQIIGMSATLPNIDRIATWLNAAVYQSTHRPVPLVQYLKVGTQLLTLPTNGNAGGGQDDNPSAPLVLAAELPPAEKWDPDHIGFLTRETVDQGHSVLVFCATKKTCMQEATLLSKHLEIPEPHPGSITSIPENESEEDDREFTYSREAVAVRLEERGGELSRTLAALVRKGVAYHNSDLDREEKDLIVGAYRRGAVNVLCATSTLAAGVNLPARRVIFMHAYVSQPRPEYFLSASKYHQMAGRAGRTGMDDRGEAILIYSSNLKVPRPHLEYLLRSKPENIESCLTTNSMRMQRAMLEAVASGAATTSPEMELYVNSFLAASSGSVEKQREIVEAAKAALQGLARPHLLIEWDREKEVFRATPKGKAVMSSGLSPEEALTMMADLSRAQENFNMGSELLPCYLCVPVHLDLPMYKPEWQRLYRVLQNLKVSEMKVAEGIGISLEFVSYMAHGGGQNTAQHNRRWGDGGNTSPEHDQERRHHRFYAACILSDLIDETPKEEVKTRYGITSDRFVGEFQDKAARFALKGKAFCERLSTEQPWSLLGAVLDQFSKRISVFAKPDILPLTAIKGVKTNTARFLFSAGMQDAEAIALADIKTIVKALETSVKYQGKSREESKAILHGKAREIKEAAMKLQLQRQGDGGGATQKTGVAGNSGAGSDEPQGLRRTSGANKGGKKSPGSNKRSRERLEDQSLAAGGHGGGIAPSGSRLAGGKPRIQEPQDGERPPEIAQGGCTEEWEALEAVAAEFEVKQRAAIEKAAVAALAAEAEAEAAEAVVKKRKLEEQQVEKQREARVREVTGKPDGQESTEKKKDDPIDAKSGKKGTASGGTTTAAGTAKIAAPSKVSLSKPPPRGLFYLANEKRLKNFIGMLADLPRFAAEFVLVPQPNAVTSATVAAATAAVLAPTAPRTGANKKGNTLPLPPAKRQRGQNAAAGALAGVVPMDYDLDGGDLGNGAGPSRGTTAAAARPSGPKPGTVLGLALSWGPGSAAYIPLHGQPGDFSAYAATQLASVMVRSDIEIVWFGWKDQVEATRWLMSHASESSATSPGSKEKQTRGASHLSQGMVDVRIAAWMCRPDLGDVRDGVTTDINESLEVYAKKPAGSRKKVHGPDMLLQLMTEDPASSAAVCQGLEKHKEMGSRAIAACRTAALSLALYKIALAELKMHGDPALLCAMHEREMALVPVLADMQKAGVGYDVTKLQKLIPRIQRRITEVENLAYKAVGGHRFQLSSAKDIKEVIYERLQLPPPPTAETQHVQKDGTVKTSFSTKKECLEALSDKHPVVPLILEHRRLSHTLSRAKDMLNTALVARKYQPMDTSTRSDSSEGSRQVVKLNGCFFQTTTATGRLSMGEPNLQNLHRPFPSVVAPSQNALENDADEDVVMTQNGGHMELDVNIRAAIVPAGGTGRVILSADFRQIEFRMMAHFSGDPDMRAMFADGAEDPFKLLASKWRRVKLADVTSELREHTKMICYAVIYGMGTARMAEDMKISPKRAEKLKNEFLDTYSGLRGWVEAVKMGCYEQGYITTLAGRRRWLPHIRSDNWQLRSRAERESVNSVCQGSAADVAKIAMIKIWQQMIEQGLGARAAMVLQIHDELLFDVEEGCVDQLAKIVVECMEGAAPELEVPLRARLSGGKSWGELKPYELAR